MISGHPTARLTRISAIYAPEPPIAGRNDSGMKIVAFPTVHSNLRALARLQLEFVIVCSLSFSINSNGSDLRYPCNKENMQLTVTNAHIISHLSTFKFSRHYISIYFHIICSDTAWKFPWKFWEETIKTLAAHSVERISATIISSPSLKFADST